MPFAVVVTFEIADGRLIEFMPLMLENAQASLRDEPGCRQFDVATDGDKPNEIFLYEVYDDASAFSAHLETSHFKSFDRAVSTLIQSKDVRTYTSVAQ